MGPNHVLDKGYQATEAMDMFLAIKLNANDGIELCDAAGEIADGWVQETITTADATNGRITNVRLMGITRAIAGAAIARRALLAVTATGKVVTAVAGDYVVAKAMIAAAADLDHIDIMVLPVPYVLPYGAGTQAAFAEIVQDIAGAMWTGNTETGATVTYQDSDGTLDISVP
jgi:hypothetical protein